MNILIELNQPFWSAYMKYGWEDKIEGFGIRVNLINKALLEKRKLQVRYRETNYIITAKKANSEAEKYHSYFVARDGTKLAVIRRTAFKRLPNEVETITVPTDVKLKLADLFRKEVLKK